MSDIREELIEAMARGAYGSWLATPWEEAPPWVQKQYRRSDDPRVPLGSRPTRNGEVMSDELRERTARNIDRLGIPRGSDIEYRWDGSGQCIVCNTCACRIGTSPLDRETHTAWHTSLAPDLPEGTEP